MNSVLLKGVLARDVATKIRGEFEIAELLLTVLTEDTSDIIPIKMWEPPLSVKEAKEDDWAFVTAKVHMGFGCEDTENWMARYQRVELIATNVYITDTSLHYWNCISRSIFVRSFDYYQRQYIYKLSDKGWLLEQTSGRTDNKRSTQVASFDNAINLADKWKNDLVL